MLKMVILVEIRLLPIVSYGDQNVSHVHEFCFICIIVIHRFKESILLYCNYNYRM